MINKLAGAEPRVPGVADQQSAPAADKTQNTAAKQTAAAPTPEAAPKAEALLKANVQPDHMGGFVYTLTNRFTGQKVIEIPRESISPPGADGSYVPGGVVSTKA